MPVFCEVSDVQVETFETTPMMSTTELAGRLAMSEMLQKRKCVFGLDTGSSAHSCICVSYVKVISYGLLSWLNFLLAIWRRPRAIR